MNNEITCLYLWKDWSTKQPDSPYVIEAQERISQYTREDWVAMAEEAKVMIQNMGDKINNNLGELSEDDFDRLCNHLQDWFFNIDKNIMDDLAFSSIFDRDFISFLNKYGDGLNLYLYRMCQRYSAKLSNRSIS